MKKYFPIVEWLSNYKKEHLKGDISAGLTVGVMLIPQGMAYAMLAGLPPIYGLYAAAIPSIVYVFFGTSRQLSVGPVAMISLLVATGVGHLATPGSNQFILLAVLLALVVGLIQLSFGIFRLGFLVNFISHPVISGYTSAAALIIGLTQLKHLLGIDLPRSNFIHEIIIGAIINVKAIHIPTLLLGVGGITIIFLVKKISNSIPGPLVAVILSIVVVAVLGLDQNGLKIVGQVPGGLPTFEWPVVDFVEVQTLFPIALTIALIGFMESVSVAKAIQSKHKDYELNPNQELIGLGLSNIVNSFFNAFPTSGGFSRSAVNDQAGANTGLASLISATLVILTLLFLTPLFFYLPQAILASVIMAAVFGLIDFKEVRHLWKTDRRDFFMLIVTFTTTLAFGVEKGILAGVVLSLAMVIYRSTYPHVAILGKMPDSKEYRNINRFSQVIQRDEILIMRFDAQLFFANAGFLKETISQWVRQKPSLKLIIINAEAINGLDSSAEHVLCGLVDELRSSGIDLYFSGVRGPVRDIMFKTGLMDRIGKDHFFMKTHDAVQYFDNIKRENEVKSSPYAVQTGTISN